jgi:hypothetical protein
VLAGFPDLQVAVARNRFARMAHGLDHAAIGPRDGDGCADARFSECVDPGKFRFDIGPALVVLPVKPKRVARAPILLHAIGQVLGMVDEFNGRVARQTKSGERGPGDLAQVVGLSGHKLGGGSRAFSGLFTGHSGPL